MLTDYEKLYPSAFKILNSELNNNTISHAYLFEIADNKDYDFINAFAKEIILKSNNTNCKKIKHQIENNIFDGIKIIETETKTIKKEQILQLKNDLINKSIVSNYYIYIIKDANKMNDFSFNTLLKFLEEPENNIIGILVTKNIYNTIPTILSRCQIISLKDRNINNFINSEKYINQILELVNSIRMYGFSSIANLPNYFKEMEFCEITEFLNVLLYLYRDMLNCLLNNELLWFNKYEESIKKMLINVDVNYISIQIDKIIKIIDESNSNINKSMLFDIMLIELSGGVKNVKC